MTASNIHSNIIFSQQIETELEKIVSSFPVGKVFLLTEETPAKLCLPLIQNLIDKYQIRITTIEGGETHKSIRSVEKVWEVLSKYGADRKSLLINIGGGMLTDLGGFAASTFKRGMAFINIPTTLLAQVDASLGGKTGINFNGLKNEIGVFNEPNAVIINTKFLKTIDFENFLSGYAEMLKHGLIKNPAHWDELMVYDFDNIDYEALQEVIAHSVDVKKWHVENDLTEKNIRKALNFGHTVGHAFESYALHEGRPILHGYAVQFVQINYIYYSSEGNKILIRYYPLIAFFGKEYNSIEFDKHLLYFAKVKRIAAFSDLYIAIKTAKGIAEYPEVSLVGLSKDEIGLIENDLNSLLKK